MQTIGDRAAIDLAMIEPGAPSYTYRCDVCGRVGRGESADVPPPGFAALVAAPLVGPLTAAHVCVERCLTTLANRVSHGRYVSPPR